PGAAATPKRKAPLAIGTPSDIGDGWQVTVTGAASDITDAVAANNQFNPPPPDGSRYIGVPVRYAYNGTEATGTAVGVLLTGVTDGNVQLQQGQCGVGPGEIDLFSDVLPGGAVEGLVCFVVANDDIPSLLMYGSVSFDAADNVYFATK